MEPKKKEEIIRDLKKFSESKEYYKSIGKAWKRGYLLHGPPGTGKSTLIAAIANYLNYHVYDLELTTVENNRELKNLLITTLSKSVLVIEDIDCTLDLTGKRENTKKKISHDDDEDEDEESEKEKSISNRTVTLSGLLNMTDGLWSASPGEMIILFTTNHLDKLDPALIRRGRMDKHIEMSYCRFEAFKVLAKNYLKIDSHNLFKQIGNLLDEADMTPADVAENITPKSDKKDATCCLYQLIAALKEAKNKKARSLIEDSKEEEEKERSIILPLV